MHTRNINLWLYAFTGGLCVFFLLHMLKVACQSLAINPYKNPKDLHPVRLYLLQGCYYLIQGCYVIQFQGTLSQFLTIWLMQVPISLLNIQKSLFILFLRVTWFSFQHNALYSIRVGTQSVTLASESPLSRIMHRR